MSAGWARWSRRLTQTGPQTHAQAPVEGDAPRPPLLIGVIPWPVYIVLLLLIGSFLALGKLPTDIIADDRDPRRRRLYAAREIGRRLPGAQHARRGGDPRDLRPSFLVYAHLAPRLAGPIKTFTKDSQFLYLFIAAIIVGSDPEHGPPACWCAGFLKIFVPIVAGTVAAIGVGMAVGTALGMNAHQTFFYVLVPAHGGRRWRRRDPAVDRLCGDLLHQDAGRAARAGAAPGDVRAA